MDEDEDEDALLQQALALSMSGADAPPQPPAEVAAPDYLDPAALSAMLAEVTGQDAENDPLVQAALEQIRQERGDASGAAGKKRKDEGDGEGKK